VRCDKFKGMSFACVNEAKYEVTQTNRVNGRVVKRLLCEEHKDDHFGKSPALSAYWVVEIRVLEEKK
jgi:hypothetical protein